MSGAEAKQVRQEIDELLTSGRLERLETVSAHIFQMFGQQWKEVTDHNVFVHVFHDSLDDVNKILARDRFKMVFNFVPLSASFTFTSMSKKFVRLSLNKFDRTAPAYGFGFSNPHEKELFCTQLDRIRNYAKSTLTPTLRMTSLEMENLSIRSPSTTPPRPALPHMYIDAHRRDYHGPPMPAYNQPPPLPPPFECAPPSYKHQPPAWESYSQPPFYCQPPPAPPFMNSFEIPYQNDVSNDYSFREDSLPFPEYDPPDLSKNSAEHGVSFHLLRITRFFEVSNDNRNLMMSSRASNRSENPAGVIGSPVKGKGGICVSRNQVSNTTWQWQ
ncbi:hypothetical protein NECAME_11432 [Necator americanus]|uniref:WH1 domain-containing protein n=1 Tax=Necator americanus TaxID=51031 RepID=W2T742_NECAM|nr:hypothetical protein NECAME_11432 [Necator americanus]ETN76797.1 hypothetical protein NECAME_11432 [Necator americanus]